MEQNALMTCLACPSTINEYCRVFDPCAIVCTMGVCMGLNYSTGLGSASITAHAKFQVSVRAFFLRPVFCRNDLGQTIAGPPIAPHSLFFVYRNRFSPHSVSLVLSMVEVAQPLALPFSKTERPWDIYVSMCPMQRPSKAMGSSR